jgi:Ca2+-transporting ATPase
MNNVVASSFSDTNSGGFSGDDAPRGLGDREAKARLEAEGPNELPRSGQRTLPRIAIEVVREPMLLLLLGGGAIYLALAV